MGSRSLARLVLAVVVASSTLGVVACVGGDDSGAPVEPLPDVNVPPLDATTRDAGGSHDGAAPDVTSDVALDADAGTIADATLDAPADATLDAPSDAGVDAFEAGFDGGALGSFALRLSGTQYLRVPYSASLTGTSITVEAWFRMEAEPGFLCFACMPFGSGIGDTYAAWVQTGVAGSSNLTQSVTAPWQSPLYEWHHVAMTGDASNAHQLLYVDGALVQTATTWNGAANQYDGHDLLLGADDDNGALLGFMQGEIDDVRVFDVVRTLGEIQADMQVDRLGPTAGLVGEWTFDDGTGSVVHDSSGLGNDALFENAVDGGAMPTWVPTSTVQPPDYDAGGDGAAVGNYVLQFSGAQYVTVPNAWWSDPSSITVEAWMRLDAAPSFFCFACKPLGGGVADTYALWVQSGMVGASDVNTSITASWAQPLGEWHHLATTGDATNGAHLLYLDGVLVKSTSTWNGSSGEWDSHPLYFGVDEDNGSILGYLQGEIDDVRVFDVVRSASQIQADMAVHRLGPTPGLVGEWTFDEGSGQTVLDSSGYGNDAVLGATSGAEATDPTWALSASLAPVDAGHD